jgi:hypothetical protein
MVGRIKLEDGHYLVGPDGQIIRKLLDSEVAGGVALEDFGFSGEQRSTPLRFEGDNIVTHDGRVVRPLSNDERFLLDECAARDPQNLPWTIRDILHKAQSAWDGRTHSGPV